MRSKRSKTVGYALLVFVLQYLMAYLLYPFDDWWQDYKGKGLSYVATEVLFGLFFSGLIAKSILFTNDKLNANLSWADKPVKRLLVEAGINVAIVHLVLLLEIVAIYVISGLDTEQPYTHKEIVMITHWVVVSVIIGLMVSAIRTGGYLIGNWRDAVLDAAEHKVRAAENKQAAAEAQLQASKLQLDPHFVFNSLSVLSELILLDPALGHEFSENFSKVYRYMLLNASKNLIELREEIKFLNAYRFLLTTRAGDGLRFEIQVPDLSQQLLIPPLTLQLLVENAVKHNKLLKEKPLVIRVEFIGPADLLVSNNIMPLDRAQPSSGVGLRNIFERYRLLSEKQPVITATAEHFAVRVPLLIP